MSSGSIRPGAHSKPGQAVPSAVALSSQAILLDKLNARQSTPDSEALASSDEEADHHRQSTIAPSVQPPKPVRRASWLNDTSQAPSNLVRKGSFASSSMSPTASHPTTPSAESGAWGSLSASSAGLARGPASTSSFPWGGTIWHNDRKDASSRLAEVLPSPTSTAPGASSSNGLYQNEAAMNQMSPGQRDQASNSQIPFPIPLHPTPKTYRSQSYSVGQMEADAITGAMGPSAMMGSRVRTIPHSGLQHRPSRPSMLSEMANDGSALGKVNEDDDDDSAGSMQGSQHQTAEAKTIEMLTRENALLRQQQQQYQQSSRLRPRASTGLNGYFQEPVPEESDYAVDELDETNDGSDMMARRALGRRMSEFGAGPFRSPYTAFENRKLENVKKGIWQTSLGFGGLGDISQSRRHSFADVPIPQRQNSIVSLGDSIGPHDNIGQEGHISQDSYSAFSNESNFGANNSVSAGYFTGGGNLAPSQQSLAQSGYGQFPYASPQGPYSNRSASPHRGMYGLTQPRQNQLLHIVLFKCARADVFYIQEGTGLTVKVGDLVIVEADRGTDLGTVAKDNVDWQSAKELKEHYAEEQYKWLMMYSQNAAAAGDGTGAGLMAASSGMAASAVGGMGPPNPHHVQEPNPGELKPKLIKRLAQSHEIAALRDKEGQEAKAKRVCMQKVKEHGLNMEILDAEFQMDWKKLTFYYFADSYINFNSLVTDLFKIYKTRIWMSAINPASFANPTLGLQAPSGIGPGAVGVGRGSQERRQNTAAASEQGASFPAQAQNAGQRVIRPSNSHPSFNEQSVVGPTAYGITPAANFPPYSAYSPFGGAPRPGAAPYAQSMMQPMDQFQPGYPQPTDYQMGRGRYPLNPAGNGLHDQNVSPLGSQDWANAFQGLSLNGR
ncbi:hypothetical protein BR93DRAFT_879358 [Coniochaeta sp. PMI_546]|nr:hypothetical protein BR93DRAFT_879358 [Coniochaeta sp. PMI_546]